MQTIQLTVQIQELRENTQSTILSPSLSPLNLSASNTNTLRLDAYLVQVLPHLTRNQLSNRFLGAKLNGKKAKLSSKVSEGDKIELTLEEVVSEELVAQKMDLDIVWQDENSIVINKPQGMVVHPGAGNYTGTLVNGLLGSGLLQDFNISSIKKDNEDEESQFDSINDEDYTSVGGEMRPGIVHRLDKETSGLLLVAKNLKALEYYSNCFRFRKVRKFYIAIIKGRLQEKSGKIDTFFIRDPQNRKKFIAHDSQGKQALSYYQVLAEHDHYSLVLMFPWTGRTHQLRFHLTGIGVPILGDPLYSRRNLNFGEITLQLHALAIKFKPFGSDEFLFFRSDMPERMVTLLEKIGFDLNFINKKLSKLENYFSEISID